MILIYSNSGEWGGVDVLIARFAAHLIKRGVDFRILESAGGRLRAQVPENVLIDFSELSSVSDRIKYVLCPSVLKLRDPRFPWKELSTARVLSWMVHPNDVFRGFFPFSGFSLNRLGYKSIKPLRIAFGEHAKVFDNYFQFLLNSDALIAMDGATVRTLRYFVGGVSKNPSIVPIPANVSPAVKARAPDGVLKIGYLGRMDATKWSAVEPLIRHQLAPLSARLPIEFVLVTEGAKTAALVALCRKLGVPCKVRGYMPNDAAIRWIANQTDVAVAMGTSALDMAGAGHPCIVLDPATKLNSRIQKSFRFIHETDDFTLGEFRDFPGYVNEGRSFEENIAPSLLVESAVAGRNYVKNSHDPEVCFDKLLECICGSAISVGQLGQLTALVLNSYQRTRAAPLRELLRRGMRS